MKTLRLTQIRGFYAFYGRFAGLQCTITSTRYSTEIQHTISVEVPAIMKRIMALVVFRLPKSPKAFREIPFSLVPAISVSSTIYYIQ